MTLVSWCRAQACFVRYVHLRRRYQTWPDVPVAPATDSMRARSQRTVRHARIAIVYRVCSSAWMGKAGLTQFQKEVYAAALCIPEGHVATYGEVARFLSKCDSTGQARAVGTALKRAPMPEDIPCHRIIRGDLKVGGYGGYKMTFEGPGAEAIRRKQRKLRAEGITFDACGQLEQHDLVYNFDDVDDEDEDAAMEMIEELINAGKFS